MLASMINERNSIEISAKAALRCTIKSNEGLSQSNAIRIMVYGPIRARQSDDVRTSVPRGSQSGILIASTSCLQNCPANREGPRNPDRPF